MLGGGCSSAPRTRTRGSPAPPPCPLPRGGRSRHRRPGPLPPSEMPPRHRLQPRGPPAPAPLPRARRYLPADSALVTAVTCPSCAPRSMAAAGGRPERASGLGAGPHSPQPRRLPGAGAWRRPPSASGAAAACGGISGPAGPGHPSPADRLGPLPASRRPSATEPGRGAVRGLTGAVHAAPLPAVAGGTLLRRRRCRGGRRWRWRGAGGAQGPVHPPLVSPRRGPARPGRKPRPCCVTHPGQGGQRDGAARMPDYLGADQRKTKEEEKEDKPIRGERRCGQGFGPAASPGPGSRYTATGGGTGSLPPPRAPGRDPRVHGGETPRAAPRPRPGTRLQGGGGGAGRHFGSGSGGVEGARLEGKKKKKT